MKIQTHKDFEHLTQTQKKAIKTANEYALKNGIDLSVNAIKVNRMTVKNDRIEWNEKNDYGQIRVCYTRYTLGA